MSSENSFDYAIEVTGLSKCYQIYDKPVDRLKQMLMRGRKQYFKEFWALKDVSFKIKKGESVGIVGRNGSGKSTLLQMICGTLNPTSGQITAKGRVAALLELGAGFNPEFTGVENVYMAASLYGLNTTEVDRRLEAIVAFADIGEHINQTVKTYSSGMYVRLAFAVIAHVDADILVVDEALAVGDAFFTQKCMRYIRNFQRNGGTLLFVSHDTGAVSNLCDKAILLKDGALIKMGVPKDVSEHYLATLYSAEQQVDNNLGNENKSTEIEKQEVVEYRDVRESIINACSLRNDIEVFSFEGHGNAFGNGGAEIFSVKVLDSLYKPVACFVGGEEIILEIKCLAHQDILSPIIGFQFKDRLGQVLFCDNTYLAFMKQPVAIKHGETVSARFEFRLPILPTGSYSICPAIADGNQNEHVQLHWLNDALILQVNASSVVMGLIGLAVRKIELESGK